MSHQWEQIIQPQNQWLRVDAILRACIDSIDVKSVLCDIERLVCYSVSSH